MQHKESRAFSPPLNCLTFFSTASPLNMNWPRSALSSLLECSLLAPSTVCFTVLSKSRTSAWFCSK
jgi:hypothetical protein